jgi:hypothetical protein
VKRKAFAALVITASAWCGALTYDRVVAAPPEDHTLSLEARVVLCVNTRLCPMQEKVNLLREVHGKMDTAVEDMNKACRTGDPGRCVRRHHSAMTKWHRLDEHLQSLLRAIEGEQLPDEEPASGDIAPPLAGEEEKSWYEHWTKDQDE